MDPIIRIFYEFLKQHKIYPQFRMNFMHTNVPLIKFCNMTPKEWWLTYSFTWSGTKEGTSFWHLKSVAWRDFLENHKNRTK